MISITQLDLEGTPIKKFPLSFKNLTRLKQLHLGDTVALRYDGRICISNISMMTQLADITAWR